jgi:UDP-N-acetylenolpyruvoylglucosamine reductase
MSGSAERYLFLGVGGMGMAPLSGWLAQSGASVLGCDDNLQEPVRRFLIESGVEVRDFVFPETVRTCTTVVYSSAVQAEHPLLKSARNLGLRCLRRGELLAEIAATKRFIAVAGSHGKTTTSGMIAHVLNLHGVQANYILGGFFRDGELPPSAYSGESPWLIAEVDESDGTIEGFSPEVTVLLNIDWDHADRYAEAAHSEAAFHGLLERTSSQVYLPVELAGLSGMLSPDISVKTFGVDGDFAVGSLDSGGMKLSGAFHDAVIEPPAVGRFNQTNGAAALAVCQQFIENFDSRALSAFSGIDRRQSVLYRDPNTIVVEDYAHHPTEIRALLECLRAVEPDNYLLVVFQAHRFSRTKQFKRSFADALSLADCCALLPVYPAHEAPLDGGQTKDLQAAFEDDTAELLSMNLAGLNRLRELVPMDQPTTVAFVGAGDLDQFAELYAAMLQSEFDLEKAWAIYLKDQVSPDCVLRENEALANKTTLRVGGAARFYAEPTSLTDLRALLRAAKLFGLPVFHLGRGSNLLVPDEGFDGLVIRFNAKEWRQVEVMDADRIWVAAGARLKEICGQAAKAGLSGFEFLEGIPGSVGGALRMNAGAMGNWMFDVVDRVQYLDESGRYHDLPKEAFHFGYRKVEEIARGVALGAILKSVTHEDENCIRDRMDSYSTSRKASQPRDPSAGCIFKNPEGNFAGRLIDEHGVKGMQVGAAEVSGIHGNFIINKGGATAADVIELVRRVRATIREKSGYVLEPEVLLMGKDWDEVLAEPSKCKEAVKYE